VIPLLLLLAASSPVADIDGRPQAPLAPPGPASALFFIATDCPISNSYALEIQSICSDYAARKVACHLVYVDPDLKTSDVRKHLSEFRYSGIPAILDAKHDLVRAAGATVTPEAVLIGAGGRTLYRGRIDNVYASLGRRRPAPTERDLRRAIEETLSGKPVTAPLTKAIGCYIPRAGGVR
jgi:hypothetical protein